MKPEETKELTEEEREKKIQEQLDDLIMRCFEANRKQRKVILKSITNKKVKAYVMTQLTSALKTKTYKSNE